MDLFDLVAKITLDSSGYEKKLDEAKNKTASVGSAIGSAFGKLGKLTLAGLGAAAAGVSVLVKSAVSSYADYEQLVGGVETLFSNLEGTVSAAPQVLENAANAYRTAGLSANEYMETVTSFSAALVSSLEGDYTKAAQISDMAITDMSDNANKMGTSMESIQMAYQGFAKQNYTMLDNLKLGYGGTKSEMERLLADAEKISGVKYDISNLSDVYEAIHVIQGELGITGTTAKEAASTISGSTAMMKASWANLMTGIADDSADFDGLINNFVDSVGTMAKNILPRVSTALKGVGKLVESLAPQISAAIPMLVTDVVPSLISAASELLQSFVNAVSTNLPLIVEEAVPLLMSLADGIVDNLPLLAEAAMKIILMIGQGLAQSAPKLAPKIVDVVLQIVDMLIENVDLLVTASIEIITSLAEGLIKSIPVLLSKAPEIVIALVKAIIGQAGQLASAALQIVKSLAQSIGKFASQLVSKGAELVSKVGQGVKSALSGALNWGKELINNIVKGIQQAWQGLKDKVGGVASAIAGKFKHSIPREGPFKRDDLWGAHMIENFTNGLLDKAPDLIRAATQTADSVASAMQVGDMSVGGSYSAFDGNGYNGMQPNGVSIYGDVSINIDGAGKNAEELGRDLYKMLVRQGGVAYAY